MAYYQSTFLGFPTLSGSQYVYVASAGLTNVVFKAQPSEIQASTATEVAFGLYQWLVPDLSAPYKLYVNGNIINSWGGSTGKYVVSNDLATISYVDFEIATRVHRAGDTLLGPYYLTYAPTGNGMDVILMEGGNVSASSVPTKGYVDARVASATSQANYLPLSGGTLNGAVTYNATPLTFVATNILGSAASADLASITADKLLVNRGTVLINNDIGNIGSSVSAHLKIQYTDTSQDPHYPFEVAANSSTELPEIKITSELFGTTAPATGAIFSQASQFYGTASNPTLAIPNKWLEIKDHTGTAYLIPAYLKP
jgi:hypothetical protein